ncbi:uncharacterized protein [Nicotiana sylvestris]|uniref:uncharacterized protein n=1 Tax=Nicotiana sylvestris TaxID=4096 RepID=UPI00388CCECB
MSNPQDNPGTPPPPSPSSSSTPPPPSTTTQPRRMRAKILARKTVATSALSKKLNDKLKPRQAQESENPDDSFKSESEGEGTGSSNSEKAQNSPSKVSSALAENLENRFVLIGSVRNVELPELGRIGGKKKDEKENEKERVKWQEVRGSGSGEAVEGLVNLSSQIDEPGSSIRETLADLLKKVSASYDPKKRRTPIPKAPSIAKPSKKRKASPQQLLKFPCQGKVAESSEAIDVEEMEQVNQEDHTTIEVQTPKPKKTKTSSKKSSSVSKATEPSLSKSMVRTRATGHAGRPPVPPTEATRGRGRDRGRGRGRGIAAGATPMDPLVAPAQDQAPAAPVQAPAVPIVIPGL